MSGKRVLFLGDIVGEPGRRAVTNTLPSLIEQHKPDLVIANGENVAGGLGITPRTADKLFEAGIDVLTTGNHVYRHRDVYELLDTSDRIVRPANYLETQSGPRPHRRRAQRRALGGREPQRQRLHAGRVLAVSRRSTACSRKLEGEADYVFVDFHAEATSEKVAMGWHLDGRALAGRRHPHPCPDRGRARAARRHGVHLGRRHDGRARRRDRREEGADPASAS